MIDSYGNTRTNEGHFEPHVVGGDSLTQADAGVTPLDDQFTAAEKVRDHQDSVNASTLNMHPGYSPQSVIRGSTGDVSIIPVLGYVFAFVLLCVFIPTFISAGFGFLKHFGIVYAYALPAVIVFFMVRWKKFSGKHGRKKATKIGLMMVLWLVLRSASFSLSIFIDLLFPVLIFFLVIRSDRL